MLQRGVDPNTLPRKLFSFGNCVFIFLTEEVNLKLFFRLTAVQIVLISICTPSVVDLLLLGKQFVESFMRSFIGILRLQQSSMLAICFIQIIKKWDIPRHIESSFCNLLLCKSTVGSGPDLFWSHYSTMRIVFVYLLKTNILKFHCYINAYSRVTIYGILFLSSGAVLKIAQQFIADPFTNFK